MAWLRRLKGLWKRDRWDLELDEELRYHLDRRISDSINAGMSPREAWEDARQRFGNFTMQKERTRDMDILSWLESFAQDVRYGVRSLARNPGFAVVAILTLALGIGANTAIFSVLNSVLLRTLPVKNPQQLVLLTNPDEHGRQIGFGDGDRDLLTYPEFWDLAARNDVFQGMLAAASYADKGNISIVESGDSGADSTGEITLVSGSYFSVLGVNPLLGHAFGEETDRVRDANPVAVISYGFWQSRFGADSGAIGKRIRFLNATYEVIGVAPPGFTGETVGDATDIWIPLTMQTEVKPGPRDYLATEKNPFEKTEWLQVIGRLKPGVSEAQAKAAINVTFQQYLQSQIGSMTSENARTFLNQHLAVTPGGRGTSVLQSKFGKPLQILMGLVGLVLLIACANVANLLLARGASRQKEIVVRLAMGAGSLRLARQVLTESLLLAGFGGILGLLLARWGDAALIRLVSGNGPLIALDVRPSAAVLAFTFGISALTGILFGMVPAWRASRMSLAEVMKVSSRGVVAGGLRRGRFQAGRILVVGQVALSLLLLAVAGLFVHSFEKLTETALGFNPDRLLVFRLTPTVFGYKSPAIKALFHEVLERVATIPGVKSVTLDENGLLGSSDSDSPIQIEGFTPQNGQKMDSTWNEVGPNYFSSIGIPILMGREIGPQDDSNAERVGVVNETFARYFFGNASPLGKRVEVGNPTSPTGHDDFVIVGVAADAKYHSIREDVSRRFYVSFFHPIGGLGSATIVVRTAGSPAGLSGALREAVRQAAQNLPPPDIAAMNSVVSDSLTTDRMIMKLSGVFGALAVLLSCIGIYGMMAYAVAGRTNEIGIRMALGAQRGNVFKLVIGQGMTLAGAGLVLGLIAAAILTRFLTSMLFHVKAFDPITYGGVTLLLGGVAFLACYIPARRATRVDPLVALRYE